MAFFFFYVLSSGPNWCFSFVPSFCAPASNPDHPPHTPDTTPTRAFPIDTGYKGVSEIPTLIGYELRTKTYIRGIDLLIFDFFRRGLGWYIPGCSDLPLKHSLLPLLAKRFSFSMISSFTLCFVLVFGLSAVS